MKTLWTFGCSHTQGHGLPDCVDSKGDPLNKISQLAWPNHLGELMNIPVINNSHAGIGPKAVWNNIINSNIQPGDVVVIMWPCWESRVDLLIDPGAKSDHALQIKAIRAWNEEDESYFDNYYQQYDRWIEYHLLARHIQDNYSNNIKLIQTVYDEYQTKPGLPPSLHVEFTQIAFGMDKYCSMPKASDNEHNGLEAHQAFANDLYTEAFC